MVQAQLAEAPQCSCSKRSEPEHQLLNSMPCGAGTAG